MAKPYLVIDIATAPIEDAAQYLDPVSAPVNYKDPEKIAAYVKEKETEQAERAGLDIDLCQITGVGIMDASGYASIKTRKVNTEAELLEWVDDQLHGRVAVSYNGLKFDWPVLMRRAVYLDVPFQPINLDRYRSEHIDVYDRMTNHGVLPSKSLRFYANRFGWLDIEKPLDGAAEAKVLMTGEWASLERSIHHDVTACYRLAQKIGAIR